jgi:hypothetical protein
MMKRIILIAGFWLAALPTFAQPSYYIQGFLRQGNAQLARRYLQIIDGAATNAYQSAAGSNITIVTNGYLYTISTSPGINGTNGADGAPGSQGPQGIPGVDGTNGVNVSAQDDVVWESGAPLAVGYPFLASVYSIAGNVAINTYTGILAGKTVYGTLSVTNATASTYTITVGDGVLTADGVRVVYVTNGSGREFTFKIGQRTNMINFPSF